MADAKENGDVESVSIADVDNLGSVINRIMDRFDDLEAAVNTLDSRISDVEEHVSDLEQGRSGESTESKLRKIVETAEKRADGYRVAFVYTDILNILDASSPATAYKYMDKLHDSPIEWISIYKGSKDHKRLVFDFSKLDKSVSELDLDFSFDQPT